MENAIEQTITLETAKRLFESGLPVFQTKYVWLFRPDDTTLAQKHLGLEPAPRWYVVEHDHEFFMQTIKKYGRWFPAPTAEELAEYLILHIHDIITAPRLRK